MPLSQELFQYCSLICKQSKLPAARGLLRVRVHFIRGLPTSFQQNYPEAVAENSMVIPPHRVKRRMTIRFSRNQKVRSLPRMHAKDFPSTAPARCRGTSVRASLFTRFKKRCYLLSYHFQHSRSFAFIRGLKIFSAKGQTADNQVALHM